MSEEQSHDPSGETHVEDVGRTASQSNSGEARDRPVGDVFSQFGQELTEALRSEVAQLREELGSRARDAAKGTGFLAAAGVTGAVAGAAVLSLPLILLRRLLPPGGTAILVAAGAGAATAYLAKRGLEELGEVMPDETEQLKQSAAEAAKEAARRVTGSG
jgi:hypothetical protein